MTMNYAPVPVERLWPKSTIAIFASGPSLTKADTAYVRDRVDATIVINASYQEMAPWADVLYGSDCDKFWQWHQGAPSFTGMKYTVWSDGWRKAIADKFGIPALRRTGDTGLEIDPGGLRTGHNSAYAAINLAVHLGAARIILLGLDMRVGPKGEQHCHPDHPNKSGPPFGMCLEAFKTLVAPLKALGIEVVNCSRRTAVTAFPCRNLEVCLP